MFFRPPNAHLIKVSHIPQQRDGECLVACADMVLRYYGIKKRYWRLRQILKIQNNVGTPFPFIKNLQKLGVTVNTYSRGTIELLNGLINNDWPVIVSVQTGQLDYWNRDVRHAVVVVGFDSDSVYINDPELTTGARQVSIGDFDLAWLENDEIYAIVKP